MKGGISVDQKDCVAIVTGGASGLGEACIRELLKGRAKVAILDIAQERGERISAELGDRAIFCKTDVVDEKSVQSAIDKSIEIFGALHVVINCAGISIPAKVLGREGPISMDLFNLVVQINLMGTINVIRLAVKKIVANEPNDDGEKGIIINTASAAAFEGQIGQAAYSASKAGVVGMTLPMAREFADDGLRVVTIAPGLFDTPMLAELPEKAKEGLKKMMLFPKRLGKPVEFAKLVQHIIENPMLNGEVIRLDGAIRLGAK